MRSHIQIIRDAGGYQGLASKLRLEPSRTRFWERRESIPSEYWADCARARVAGLRELASAAASKRDQAA